MAARGACALSRRGRLLAAARLSELCKWSSSATLNCSASSELSGRLEVPQQNHPPPDGPSAAQPQRLGKLIDTAPSQVPFCSAHSLQCQPVDRRLHRCMSSHAAAGVAAGSTATSAVLDFPGARFAFVNELHVVPETTQTPIPCYRVLDELGQLIPGAKYAQISEELAVAMYRKMAVLQSMDLVFYDAQRQGRFSFYMTTAGEEAINIASAAAISDLDTIFAQYREPGVLLWRGFSMLQFAHQCFATTADLGKGRQMPVHYGSKDHRFHTISSPLATQIPHAVGAAYAVKQSPEDACVVTYFGEGAASEGDFHGAINFAATLEVPVIFVCRNNGWAISTPAREQYRGDGIVGRGQAYGVRSLRVDGNDTLAMYSAMRAAREMAVTEERPILVEAMTYRTGHHSTSDDSSRYRGAAEIQHWKLQRDPVARFRRWLQGQGWWDDRHEEELRKSARAEVIAALDQAEATDKAPLRDLFTDVYDKPPPNLVEQEQQVRGHVAKHRADYPDNIALD